MNDTPRMDVIWNDYLNDDFGYYDYSGQLYLEGQKLEVELAAALAQRDKLVEALKLIEDHHNETEEWRNIAHEALKECGNG